MKHVLLIGGAGYVGSALTLHLLKEGIKVTVLDNFVYGNHASVTPFLGDKLYTLINGDLGAHEDLARASEGVTDVVVLGGLVGDPITKTYPAESDAINSRGIQACIDFFDDKQIDKLIFISTCSNYGLITGDNVADENYQLSPLSLYAKAKVAGEQYLMSKKGSVSYTGVVLRFATAFGISSRMRFDLSISEFTRDLYFGKELLVFDEHTWRPYCHIRDFSRLISIVLKADKQKVDFQVFNAGGDVNNYTKKMIVDAICTHIPDAKVKYGVNGSDPRNYRVSFEKVKTVLGFEPAFTVEAGIVELIEAFKAGIFGDSLEAKEKYGNYTLEYKIAANEVSAGH